MEPDTIISVIEKIKTVMDKIIEFIQFILSYLPF